MIIYKQMLYDHFWWCDDIILGFGCKAKVMGTQAEPMWTKHLFLSFQPEIACLGGDVFFFFRFLPPPPKKKTNNQQKTNRKKNPLTPPRCFGTFSGARRDTGTGTGTRVGVHPRRTTAAQWRAKVGVLGGHFEGDFLQWKKRTPGCLGYLLGITPMKIDMEHNHGGLKFEDHFPF